MEYLTSDSSILTVRCDRRPQVPPRTPSLSTGTGTNGPRVSKTLTLSPDDTDKVVETSPGPSWNPVYPNPSPDVRVPGHLSGPGLLDLRSGESTDPEHPAPSGHSRS